MGDKGWVRAEPHPNARSSSAMLTFRSTATNLALQIVFNLIPRTKRGEGPGDTERGRVLLVERPEC